jgi:hypothetical protein
MAKQTFTTGQVLTAAQMTSLQQTAMLGGAATAKTSSYTLVAADAGTSITMSNASATIITVNTALFAAGDTVQITNLGAGVCTITAGTATVNTSASLALAQYESGTLTFTSTSAAIFIKGAGAAAASGSLTLLSTTSLSGSTTTISSISQSYYGLKFLVYGVNMSADNFFHVKVNGTSGLIYELNAEGTGVVSENNGNDLYFAGSATIKGGNTTNAWVVNIDSYASTVNMKPFDLHGTFTNSSNAIKSRLSQGTVYTNTAISSLQFNANSGTFTGTVKLYGVN